MIVDYLSCFKRYLYLHKNFSKVLEFCEQNTLNSLEEGNYSILGKNIFLSINQYKTQISKDFEAHQQYIDIQLVLEGTEYIEWCPLAQTQTKIAYDKNKDIVFLSGIGQKFKATKDLFFIFFPEDAHRPSLPIQEPEYVKKAVFKIKV